MPWTVTLEVTECGSSSVIAGAIVKVNNEERGNTDASGRLLLTFEDTNISPIVAVNNPTGVFTWIANSWIFDKNADAGTIKSVCLENAPWDDEDNPDVDVGETPDGGCFIVTAATGSTESREVTGLRRLRENVRAKSALAGRLIDAIYDDYAGFSPQIASELKGDTLSRTVVLESVVKPLFAWYILAGKLAIGHAGPDTVPSGVRNLIDACPDYLGKTILPHLESIRKGEGLPKHAPAQFVELVPRIGQLPFATWGILDPLIRAWRSATEDLDPADQIAQWLANAPIEALSPPDNGKLLEKELGALTHFFDFRPGARAHLGQRLAAQWPHAAQALESTGFINPSQKQ